MMYAFLFGGVGAMIAGAWLADEMARRVGVTVLLAGAISILASLGMLIKASNDLEVSCLEQGGTAYDGQCRVDGRPR